MKPKFTPINVYYYFNIVDKTIGMFMVVKNEYQIFDNPNLPVHHLRFFNTKVEAEQYKDNFIKSGKKTDVFMTYPTQKVV
jgi:hypothetical protein